MLWLLRLFYNLTGIWGVAIILLTVVVKVVTLPLTFKQMRSMKKMREVQPELEALKKKYADDRVRQAQEMQALFQRAGVNPLAGCLPMLIQLPIWIALYAMLNTAVELYREPFLWLPDLTQQDPYYIVPLAMGALMYFQMKIQPSGVDNEQAKMMAWMMPIIFTVMMLFLPSGLCVYIFANVLLSLVQTVIQLRPAKAAVATKS
jgi:YidC/Oxa1 family membrane protein insertase